MFKFNTNQQFFSCEYRVDNLGYVRSLGVSVFQSFHNYKLAVWTCFCIHILEAVIAVRSCLQSNLGIVNALKWGLLSLFCGFSALSKVLLFGRSFIAADDEQTTIPSTPPSPVQNKNPKKSEGTKKRKKSGPKKKKL